MDGHTIVILEAIAAYFLAMAAYSFMASRKPEQPGFVIGNRKVGYVPTARTETRIEYIRLSKRVIGVVLVVAGVSALLITDLWEFIFKCRKPSGRVNTRLYAGRPGLIGRGHRTDLLTSLYIAFISLVYVIMLIRGSFEDLIMVLVPVSINVMLIAVLIPRKRFLPASIGET